MSGTEDMDPMDNRDDKTLAAEFALGLLEGEELLSARGKLANDPAFAARKEWWDGWFVPLSDEVRGIEPSPEVWRAIDAQVSARLAARAGVPQTGGGGSSANVVELESRVRRWQWTAGITSAAAALALAFLAFAPGTGPAPVPVDGATPPIAATDPLVATVPIGETGLRLDVTYIPETDRMLVAAIGLTPDGVHDHELWLVPADGSELQSLGVVVPGEVLSTQLSEEVARNMGDGVQLVLTREPIGGKPEGEAAGPVVAEGALSEV
ncbi:MAG: anti-sigma factor [Pseudomonadota bacterium]